MIIHLFQLILIVYVSMFEEQSSLIAIGLICFFTYTFRFFIKQKIKIIGPILIPIISPRKIMIYAFLSCCLYSFTFLEYEFNQYKDILLVTIVICITINKSLVKNDL